MRHGMSSLEKWCYKLDSGGEDETAWKGTRNYAKTQYHHDLFCKILVNFTGTYRQSFKSF